jgi:integrase
MGRGRAGSAPGAGAPRAAIAPAAGTQAVASERFELGPFYLWYREDRDEWCIVWRHGRGTRRKTTGIGGRGSNPPDQPIAPPAAREALGDHWAEWKANVGKLAAPEAQPPGKTLYAEIQAAWLEEHVAHLEAPDRYVDSTLVIEQFWDHLAARNELPNPLTVDTITNAIADKFITWRKAQGASTPTISRDLAALRGPITWGLKPEIDRLTSGPRIKDVKGKKKSRELEYSPEQVAVLLEAAWASIERQHVFMFAMASLSTHGRTEAILEFDVDRQYRAGLLNFLCPGEEQTRKRRSIVPACPTFKPWLDQHRGKLIVYRVPTSEKSRAAGAPDYFERPTNDIGNAFKGTLLAAHEMRPDLGFARQACDERGKPIWLEPRKKLGEREPRPKMVGIGSPNTLRHTIHTWHKRIGTPEAQIDAAAGHSEQGTGANYTHLRPEYLQEFIINTERFWEAVGEFTDVHLLYQRSTNIAAIGSARFSR